MKVRWHGFAFAFLAFTFGGLAANSSPAMAGDCACRTKCGCGDGSGQWIDKYGDGTEAPAGDLADNQFDLGEGAPAQTGSSFVALDAAGAYIDSAIVASRFRLRADAAYNNPRPDRVEFFYAECGILGGRGPQQIERNVDYQEIVPYFEWATSDKFSVFVETPIRFINPEVNPNTGGISDVNAGFKYAFIADQDEYLTAQFRIYTPTGLPARGLGTGHVSLEPSILYFRRFTDRLIFQAEIRDWIPISDSQVGTQDFAGNVLRYGMGFGYDLIQNYDCCCEQTSKLTAVGEFVGWTIMDGLAFNGFTGNLEDQTGVTIVNAKAGLRYVNGPHSFYGGYGQGLTNQVWYQDILRFEYVRAF